MGKKFATIAFLLSQIAMSSFLKIFVVIAIVGAVLYWLFWRGATNTQAPASESAPKVYQPVVYDVADFDKKVISVNANTAKGYLALLGTTATSETALDMNGQKATLYRYHTKQEPALYAIDSDVFFEMVWYYPAPSDSDNDKQLAKEYAQKTYHVAKSALGVEARGLYEAILAGKKAELPKGVALAVCENYLCTVVLQK